MLFSLAGFTNSLFAKKFDDATIIPVFVLTPLIYLGGVFYSMSQLSPFWQKTLLFNPIYYIIAAFRYSLIGTSQTNVNFALGLIILLAALFFFFNWYLMKKGIGIRT